MFIKKDVDAAFKRVWLRAEDAGRSATDLPAPEDSLPLGGKAGEAGAFWWDLDSPWAGADPADTRQASMGAVFGFSSRTPGRGVTAISLVACFGGAGSPGEWIVWAWAVQAAHACRYPEWPIWHDVVAFSSSYLMDDQVLVEPYLGVRPFLSNQAATEVTIGILWEGATNEEKDAVEGTPTTSKMVWGVLMTSTDRDGRHWGTGTASLSAAKLHKNLMVFLDRSLDPGNQRIPILTVQIARGNGEWLAVVQDSVRPELKALDAALKGARRGQLYSDPPGTELQIAELWEEFHSAVEFFRVLLCRPELWGRSFTNTLNGMLTLPERLTLPGEGENVVWTSGDATLERMGFVDWTGKSFFTVPLRPFFHALGELAGSEDDKVIIAIAEFLLLVVAAASLREQWEGKLVVYAGDNQVVLRWLETRTAGVPYARYILRLLDFLEIVGGFKLVGVYIRSQHNATPDALTREDWAKVATRLRAQGFVELPSEEALTEYFSRGYERRAWVYQGQPEEQAKVALQLADLRRETGPGRSPVPHGPPRLEGLTLFDWRSALGRYAWVWSRLGGQARVSWAAVATAEARQEASNGGWEVVSDLTDAPCAVWTSSLTLDLTGREVSYAERSWKATRPGWILCDAPRGDIAGWLQTALVRSGYTVWTKQLRSTAFGEAYAVDREVVWATRQPAGDPRELLPPDAWTGSVEQGLLSFEEIEADQWVSGEGIHFHLQPGCVPLRERGGPTVVGKLKGDGPERLVFSPHGAAHSLNTLFPSSTEGPTGRVPPLFLMRGGLGTSCRPLQLEEGLRLARAAAAQGGTLASPPPYPCGSQA